MAVQHSPADESDRSNPVSITISTQIIIWVVTIVFMAGVAYSNFVTRSEFNSYKEKSDQRIERLLEKIDGRFDQVLERINDLQKEKVDKK